MYRHHHRNYRFIGIMFWAFPWLLWQTFGHMSGFFVGVLLAVILTLMLNGLFHRSNWNTTPYAGQQTVQVAEPQPRYQRENQMEIRPYQSGYQAQREPYQAEQPQYQAGERQPQYEEMEVQYPEIPPMEQQ